MTSNYLNRKCSRKIYFLLFIIFFFFLGHAVQLVGSQFPDPGIKPVAPPAVEAWSPNHWTAREFPCEKFQKDLIKTQPSNPRMKQRQHIRHK